MNANNDRRSQSTESSTQMVASSQLGSQTQNSASSVTQSSAKIASSSSNYQPNSITDNDTYSTQESYVFPKSRRQDTNFVPTYARVVNNCLPNAGTITPRQHITSQCPTKEEISKICEEKIETSVNKLVSKLSAFIIEILGLQLMNESKRQRSLLMASVVRNHFGGEVSEEIISAIHTREDGKRKDSIKSNETLPQTEANQHQRKNSVSSNNSIVETVVPESDEDDGSIRSQSPDKGKTPRINTRGSRKKKGKKYH